METKNIIEKLKELVKKGNVSEIVVRRKGEVLLNVPEEDGQKAKDTAAGVLHEVKDAAAKVVSQVKEGYQEAVKEEKAEDADFESVVDDSEPKD